MLKLEKTSSLSGLALCFREKERFLNSQFLKALAMALCLHLGGLWLFHVSPLTLPSTFLFPPVHVQSDSSLEETSVFVIPDLKEEEDLFIPPWPLIPPLDGTSFPKISTFTPKTTLDVEAFQDLEAHLWPIWQPALSLTLEEPMIQLTISGDLAEHSLVAQDRLLSKKLPLSCTLQTPMAVTYQVYMDEKTGEIFWYECLQSSGIPAVDRLTEKILLTLRFARDPSWEMVSGILHFAILGTLP